MRAAARRGRAVVTAVSMGLCVTGSARAQVPAGDAGPAPAPRTIDVTIVAGGDDAEPLIGTIRELLGRLGLGVEPHVVATAEAAPPAAASPGLSVRVDLASRYEALTVVRRGNEEVRRTIPRESSPSIVREEIGEAVRSGVEVQLLAEAAQNAAPPAPAPLANPAPAPVMADTHPSTPAAPGWAALDLEVLAGGGPIASGAEFVPRLGGAAVIASRRRLRPSLTVSAAFLVPFESSLPSDATFPGVTMRATIVALRAVPAVEVIHGSWLAMDVGAGAGIDVISVEAPQGALLISTSGSNRVDPVVTALVTGYAAITPGIAFTLAVGGEVDLASPTYALRESGGGYSDILVPWRVRPYALAGFTFTALGGPLFAVRTP